MEYREQHSNLTESRLLQAGGAYALNISILINPTEQTESGTKEGKKLRKMMMGMLKTINPPFSPPLCLIIL